MASVTCNAPMAFHRPPPNLEGTHLLRSQGPVTVLVRRDWASALPLDALLDGAPLRAWGRPMPHELRGRGAVEVLATGAGEIVAKRLRRGGIIGAAFRELYGDPWRPAREAWVTEQLADRGCPVAPVVATRATRVWGALFRLEIATARVVGAEDLLDALRGARDAPARLVTLASAAGRTLRRLHELGLHHRDLQVKNLLVPADLAADGLLVVIDLDRCELGAPPTRQERVLSLARFARSLVKHALLPRWGEPAPPATWHACRAFLAAYGAGDHHRRAPLLAAVARRLRRSLRAHQALWS